MAVIFLLRPHRYIMCGCPPLICNNVVARPFCTCLFIINDIPYANMQSSVASASEHAIYGVIASSDSSPSPSSASSDGKRWEVVDILAERSTVAGENEFFVMWKPSWVPASDFSCPSDCWQRWDKTPKWTSCSNATVHSMQVCLAVETGSQMETDLADARPMDARQNDTLKSLSPNCQEDSTA